MPSSWERNIFELHPLEIRHLLAVQIDASGILQITSLPNPATVTVNKISNGKIVTTVNGVAQNVTNSSGTSLGTQINAGSFSRINIAGTSGNDNLAILGSVPYTGNSTIAGGDGNDTCTGGAGNDTVSGNNNNDTLDGGGG